MLLLTRFFAIAFVLALTACGTSAQITAPTTPATTPSSNATSATATSTATATSAADFAGTWVLDADRSTAIDPWRNLSVAFAQDGDAVILKRMWRGSREGGATTDSVRVVPGGAAATAPLEQWPDNRHIGAYLGGDSTKTVTARWTDDGRTLVTESTVTLSIQQGTVPVRTYTEYRLSPGNDRLDVLELRSTRPRPIHYVFHRADSNS